jgi:hypothetical protein
MPCSSLVNKTYQKKFRGPIVESDNRSAVISNGVSVFPRHPEITDAQLSFKIIRERGIMMEKSDITRRLSCACLLVMDYLGKMQKGCEIGWAKEKVSKREKVDLGYCTKDWMSSGLCGYTTSRA